jgi:hypothetical protein
MLRWLPEPWYVSLGHATHVRRAFRESAEICSPRPHLACSRHDIWRWLARSWYVSLGQSEHVRLSSRESAEISWPLLHVGCAVQFRNWCLIAF